MRLDRDGYQLLSSVGTTIYRVAPRSFLIVPTLVTGSCFFYSLKSFNVRMTRFVMEVEPNQRKLDLRNNYINKFYMTWQ